MKQLSAERNTRESRKNSEEEAGIDMKAKKRMNPSSMPSQTAFAAVVAVTHNAESRQMAPTRILPGAVRHT